MYQFKLQKFEGPLELLLSLIEERKLSVTEVSLSEVTDQYLAYISDFPALPKDELADFLVVAAKLIFLKSKLLVPLLSGEEESEERGEEFAGYAKLQESIRALVAVLQGLGGPRSFVRGEAAYEIGTFAPPDGTLDNLADQFAAIIEERARERNVRTAIIERRLERRITVAEKIQELQQLLNARSSFSFSHIASARKREEVIVLFLALLEIITRSFAEFAQAENFGEITVRAKAV